MCVTERFFYLEQEPCVIHLPEKPNGFGIMILGDYHHFVESGTSLWLQHSGRSRLLEELRNMGYTLFTSNLYGRHWGAEKAMRLAKRLYHVVMKKEILNDKIHMIAEGMGALIALDMMQDMPVRSAVMFNPCLDLPAHLHAEKEHKFFYGRLVKELTYSYEMKEENILTHIKKHSFRNYHSSVPVKMLIPIHEKKERKAIYREFEQMRAKSGNPIALSFHLKEHKYKTARSIIQFFKKHETL
ncbi:alpha/beta hydrolase [Ectobacillus antri]|uniref:alpha/beta hydrolase n=1 Tax=Ectobacillus antri TaxID=2486280 RepID=UPI000F5A96FB|nr:alpha/beta hydrolase [Ectobacillus antri]